MSKELEEILTSLIAMIAYNSTQLEALQIAVSEVLTKASVCKKGELEKTISRIVTEKAEQIEKETLKHINKTKLEKKYPDLSKLAESFFKGVQ